MGFLFWLVAQLAERLTVNQIVVGSSPIESVYTLLTRREFIMKGMLVIVLISKEEKDYLLSKGVNWGYGGISYTDSRHRRKYYLAESGFNMRLLRNYRKNCIVK